MVVTLILLIMGAYLVGSIPSAYLATKWSRGIDIRKYGSGNVGASNVFRLTTKRLTILVTIVDLGKGALMVWLARQLGLDIVQQLPVGIAAIIGHNWPVFLGFKGGRGVLTSLGVIIALPAVNGLVPWGAIAGLSVTAAGAFILRNAPLGVNASFVALPLVSLAVRDPLPITLGFAAMWLLLVIRRLAIPRSEVAATTSWRQVLINRLLFDRDIRDRDTWIRRAPSSATTNQQQ